MPGVEGKASPSRRPLVTVAALYGTGVSVIGPRLAERLDVPFLDRAVRDDVARRTGLPQDAIADIDDEPHSRMERIFSSLGRSSTPTSAGTNPGEEPLDLQEHRLRSGIEETLAGTRDTGGVVIGRGGMVVLRVVPWALHVLLRGDRRARVEQAMALDGVDRQTAEQRQGVEDRARIRYVRHAYGVDGRDPAFYDLVLDSTTIDLDTCVELVATAALRRMEHSGDTEPT
jgi:hypothetical protein